MFKTLIKWTIELLDTLVEEMKRAYTETYELSDLTKEFRLRVKEIQDHNKKAFIKAAETFETSRGIATLEFPTLKEIKQRAKERWHEALKRGDLDELYNIKEERK